MWVAGTIKYFVHANHLYSPAALTDFARTVVERYRYDAYGKQTITNSTGTVLARSSVNWNRGFTGYISDQETGLMHARGRYYSGVLGSFISRDPIGDPDPLWNANPIQYADGLSLYGAFFAPNNTDPFGTSWFWGGIDVGYILTKVSEALAGGKLVVTPDMKFQVGGSCCCPGKAGVGTEKSLSGGIKIALGEIFSTTWGASGKGCYLPGNSGITPSCGEEGCFGGQVNINFVKLVLARIPALGKWIGNFVAKYLSISGSGGGRYCTGKGVVELGGGFSATFLGLHASTTWKLV